MGKDDNYEQRMIVRYGMWLRTGDGDKPVLGGRIGVDDDLGRENGNPDIGGEKTVKALYQGHAGGLAARKHGTDNKASGQFEAHVSLTATFGGVPSLGGFVHDFEPVDPELDGDAVDRSWLVHLNPTPLNEMVEAYGKDWNATGFGENAKRPDGFYGGFKHTFKDDDGDDTGRVAGVYVAQDN